MDKIREQLKNPLIAAAIGFFAGLIIGLVVLGWGLFPVTWVNAGPKDLRTEWKTDYMRMAIESYTRNQDMALAQQRWKDLGPDANKILAQVVSSPQRLTPAEIATFGTIVQSQVKPTAVSKASPVATQAATKAPKETGKSNTTVLLLAGLCILLLVILAVAAYLLLFRNRKGKGEATPALQAQEASRSAVRTDFISEGQQAPIAQFMTTYMSGDDLYDDSFSIDSPSGDFLGECGVGISDTIGVGDPKKVTAFEVWLFDKNDIQTVTKVVMSPHAFNDPTIRQRLESKGEPVLAEPDKHVLLETATLQLEARVVEMTFGQGALPTNSFFERLTLELAIWPKETPQN
jgi:LPXTG-motif cell wall-anchored protein